MLSVVIPTLNAAQTLAETLDSLALQLVGVDYEVIVADDISALLITADKVNEKTNSPGIVFAVT